MAKYNFLKEAQGGRIVGPKINVLLSDAELYWLYCLLLEHGPSLEDAMVQHQQDMHETFYLREPTSLLIA